MSDPSPPIEGEDLTAAEYALGVLDRSERTAAEARASREPAFAAEVQAWDERLSPLIGAIASVTPPATLWPRVVRAIDGTAAANDSGRAGPTRHTVAFWRNWALGATAAAALALVVLAIRPPQVVTAPASHSDARGSAHPCGATFQQRVWARSPPPTIRPRASIYRGAGHRPDDSRRPSGGAVADPR